MRYILALLVLFLNIRAYSQNLQNPIDRGNNALNLISSDFGPRYVNSATATKFHFGLDYGLAYQNPAYPVEAGVINHLPTTNIYTAYVEVGSWRYMHVFFGQTPTGLWELKLDNYGDPVLIIRSNATTPTNVYVEAGYPRSTYEDNGITLPVSRTIGQDVVVFRSRDNHLHLDRGNLVFSNPLSFLPRPDVNSPATTVRLKYNSSNAATAFSSDIVYGNIIVESDVDYQNEKDLDNVIIELIQNNQPANLFSWHYTGNNHITLLNNAAGTSNTPQYNIRQIGVVNTILTDVREGIFPRDGAGRDILKYTFNSQQTDPSSTLANGLRYPDGQYTFRVTATDLGGNNTPQNLVKTIDNLRPYIEKVEIRKNTANGDALYTGEWRWSGTALNLSQQNLDSATENDDIWVKITASEPMTSLALGVLVYASPTSTPNGDSNTAAGLSSTKTNS